MTKPDILNNIIYKWALACLNDVEKKRKVFIIWDCISGCKKVYPEKAIEILNSFKQTEDVKNVKKYIMEHYKITEAEKIFKGELF